MNYTDANRGVIQNRERARQIVNFGGIRYDNITPTDIDGFFEKGDKAFVFYEYKLVGNDLPHGQKLALERLVDAVRMANREAVLFVCKHTHISPDEDIDAKNAIVDWIYWNGQWHKGKNKTVKEQTDSFMAYINKKAAWLHGL